MSSNMDDLRSSVATEDFETDFGIQEEQTADTGRIFGLTAGERMILSIILFLAVTVLGVALLFITKTIALPS